ncbi:hypothetical protein ACMH5Q_08565 [Aquirufa lenticrescens]
MNHKIYVEEFSELELVLFPAITILLADGNVSSTEFDYLINEKVFELVGEQGIFPDMSEEAITSEFKKTVARHNNEIKDLKEKCFVSNECCKRLWDRTFFESVNKNEQSRILKLWNDLANADEIITLEEGQVLEQFTHIILFGNLLPEEKRAAYNKANPNSPWLKK